MTQTEMREEIAQLLEAMRQEEQAAKEKAEKEGTTDIDKTLYIPPWTPPLLLD